MIGGRIAAALAIGASGVGCVTGTARADDPARAWVRDVGTARQPRLFAVLASREPISS